MALTADMMVKRSRHPTDDFHTTSWQLDGEDLKIDHYLSMYYTDLTPQDDKRRCAVATDQSTSDQACMRLGQRWKKANETTCTAVQKLRVRSSPFCQF